jgi:SecD/SecF fusion protein
MEYKFVSTSGTGGDTRSSPEGTPAPAETDKSGSGTKASEDSSGCGQAEEESAPEDQQDQEKEKEKPAAEPAASAKDDAKQASAEEDSAPADDDAKSLSTTPPTSPPAADPSETPPVDVSAEQTTLEIRFPQNKISAYALEEHINTAAEKALHQNPFVKVDNPEWDKRDNTAFETWTVTMALSEENTRRVLAELESTMEASPVWQNSSSVSGQVTLDMQLKALYAILVSLLGIAAYVWFRFQKLGWGIAGIAALVHDTLVMIAGIGLSYYVAPYLGFLGIQEFKISLTVVAGFLTLIGYSINDTIVIFDRIREIRGKNPHITMQMINDAVNQTLSRTLLTGGLTLVVVGILYIWGGEGIHTFAFCMLIGVISGTYSTVFIGAPLLLWLMKTGPVSAATSKTTVAKQPMPTGGSM